MQLSVQGQPGLSWMYKSYSFAHKVPCHYDGESCACLWLCKGRLVTEHGDQLDYLNGIRDRTHQWPEFVVPALSFLMANAALKVLESSSIAINLLLYPSCSLLPDS